MDNNVNNEDFVVFLIKKLNEIQKEFENKTIKKCCDDDVSQLKINLLNQEFQKALMGFDVPLASRIQKELNKIETKSEDKVTKTSVLNEQQKQELRREMAYEAFFQLKKLPNKQASLILGTSKELKSILGDWYSTLSLWLNC